MISPLLKEVDISNRAWEKLLQRIDAQNKIWWYLEGHTLWLKAVQETDGLMMSGQSVAPVKCALIAGDTHSVDNGDVNSIDGGGIDFVDDKKHI